MLLCIVAHAPFLSRMLTETVFILGGKTLWET